MKKTPIIYSLNPFIDAEKELLSSLFTRRLSAKFIYWQENLAKVYEEVLQDRAICPKHRQDKSYIPKIYSYIKENLESWNAGEKINFISLGVGVGDIEEGVAREMKKDNKKANFVFLDFSKYFLLTAYEKVSKVVPQEDIYPIHCDFTKDSDGYISSLVRNLDARKNVFFMCGELFAKYQPSILLHQLSFLMEKGDYLFVDFNIFPAKQEKWMSMVASQIQGLSNQRYYMERVKHLGLPTEEQNIEFVLRDETYNNFWNIYSRELVFKDTFTYWLHGKHITFFPDEHLSLIQYHFFKENFVEEFFKRSNFKLLTLYQPFPEDPLLPLRWAMLRK